MNIIKTIPCILLLLISNTTYGQEDSKNHVLSNSSSKQNSDETEDSISKEYYEKLSEIYELVKSESEDKEAVGELILRSDKAMIYDLGQSPCHDLIGKTIVIPKKKKRKQDTLVFKKQDTTIYTKFIYDTLFVTDDSIEEVLLRVENAAIYDIRVQTKSGLVFINRHNLPPLINWEKRTKRYKLHLASISAKCGNVDAFIYLDDFLDYKAFKRYKMDDKSAPILLNSDNRVDTLYSGKKLENLINFRIYSDFLALINETPNGLVQFQGDANFYINMKPYGRFYFLNYFNPFINISRFDSESKYVIIDEGIYDKQTNLDYLQKLSVYSGVVMNLATYVTRDLNTKFDLNIGGYFGTASYQIDTVIQEDNLNAISYFMTAKVVTQRISNFIFDYGITLMYTVPYRKSDLTYEDSYLTTMLAGELRYIINIKNELFFRTRFIGNGYNAFHQIQIGYKAQIPIPSAKKGSLNN